jgi:hypothetical protein
VHYYTTLPVIFGVKKYADALTEIVKERGIILHLRFAVCQKALQLESSVGDPDPSWVFWIR